MRTTTSNRDILYSQRTFSSTIANHPSYRLVFFLIYNTNNLTSVSSPVGVITGRAAYRKFKSSMSGSVTPRSSPTEKQSARPRNGETVNEAWQTDIQRDKQMESDAHFSYNYAIVSKNFEKIVL